MSNSDNPRKPQAFNVKALSDAPSKAKSTADGKSTKADNNAKARNSSKRKPRAIKNKAVLTPIPDAVAEVEFAGNKAQIETALAELELPPAAPINRKRFSWSKLVLGAFGGLVTLGVGLYLQNLITELFATNDFLGWLGVGLTALIVIGLVAISIREFAGISRLRKIETLRVQGVEANSRNDIGLSRQFVANVTALYSERADTANGRDVLAQQSGEVIDGRDLIALAEENLMTPLDTKAKKLVMDSAKRVSVVTAVSPRALVDIGFVLMENLRLIRKLSELYGGRPGSLGFWRLTRNVIGHLAVTGTIAVGDSLVQQLVGHGLAARLSARLGEGVINGLLTARVGISAIDLCRPMPFQHTRRPKIGDFLSDLTKLSGLKGAPKAAQ